MPARRAPRDLKIPRDLRILPAAAKAVEKDAQLGGLGIEWRTVPPVLDEAGRAEWQRLAEVFAQDPTRFREGDRAALTAYAAYWSAFVRAAEDVAARVPTLL